MHLMRLVVRDFKRVSVVELRFDGAGLVPVAGRNAQGKTSTLDALAWAFGGPRALPALEQPVREGAERATVIAETDEFVLTRTAGPAGRPRLTVASRNGAAFAAPQALLDRIFTDLTFDPAAFARLGPKLQRERWIEALGLGAELAALERAREEAFAERRDANRDVRQLEAQLEGFEEPGPFTPDEEVSVAELVGAIGEAQALASKNASERIELERADSDLSRATADVERLREELRRAEIRHGKTLEHKRVCEKIVDAHKDPGLEELQRRFASVESDNREARAAKQYRETATRLDGARLRAAELDRRVESAEVKKHEMLSGADLPIEGLTLTDEGLLYRGVPFSQASTSEQIRISVAVAIALEPELRCLRIAEGSLLDAETRRGLDELAREREFLILVETVADGPTGAPGEIYIEDGEVLAPSIQVPPDAGMLELIGERAGVATATRQALDSSAALQVGNGLSLGPAADVRVRRDGATEEEPLELRGTGGDGGPRL